MFTQSIAFHEMGLFIVFTFLFREGGIEPIFLLRETVNALRFITSESLDLTQEEEEKDSADEATSGEEEERASCAQLVKHGVGDQGHHEDSAPEESSSE